MAGKVDLDEMQRWREENKHDNQGLFTFSEGDAVLYVCQPCDDDATLCFVDLKQHKIAQDKPPVVCLDADKNKVLTHPRVVDFLEQDGKDIEGGCPVCESIADGTFDGEVKKAKAKTSSLWNFVPMKYRKDARIPWEIQKPFEVRQCAASYSVSDGIIDVFGNEGDISDPEKAIFVRVNRKGKGQFDTEYTVHTDSETLRKPYRFSKEQRAIIDEALAPGGNGDLYRIIANFTKTRDEVIKLLGGMEEEETKPGKPPKGGASKPRTKEEPPKKSAKDKGKPHHHAAASSDEEAPDCYSVDCTPTDSECQECAFKEPCAEACGVDVPPDRLVAKPGKSAAPKVSATVKAEKVTHKPKTKAEIPPEEEEEAPEDTEATEDGEEEEPAEEEDENVPKEFVAVSEAEVDSVYTLPNGAVAVFKGTSKGKGFFDTEAGKRIVLAVTDLVSTVVADADEEPEETVEEAANDEDDTLDEMERMLAQKQKTAAAKGKGNGKAART